MAKVNDSVELVLLHSQLAPLTNNLWRQALMVLVGDKRGWSLAVQSPDMLVRFALDDAPPIEQPVRVAFACDQQTWKPLLDWDAYNVKLRLLFENASTPRDPSESRKLSLTFVDGQDPATFHFTMLDARRLDELDFAFEAHELADARSTAGERLEVASETLWRMLEVTTFARASGAQRFRLDKMLFEQHEDGFRICGSDGKQLAIATAKKTLGALAQPFVLPSFAVNALEQLIRHEGRRPRDTPVFIDVATSASGVVKNVTFRARNSVLVVNAVGNTLGSSQWPDYKLVLPDVSKYDAILTVDSLRVRHRLQAATRAAPEWNPLARQVVRVKRLNDKNVAVTLENHNLDSGMSAVASFGADIEARDTVECDEWSGSWQLNFLLDAVSQWSRRGTLSFASKPIAMHFNVHGAHELEDMLVLTAHDEHVNWWYGAMAIERH